MKKFGHNKPGAIKREVREDAESQGGLSKENLKKHYDTIQDVVAALYEHNRSRVRAYYCMNPKCPTTFWQAEGGHHCPACGTLGLISEFRGSRSGSGASVICGYMDSLGRLYCPQCARHYRIEDDISYIVYEDTRPYNTQTCDACRRPLAKER